MRKIYPDSGSHLCRNSRSLNNRSHLKSPIKDASNNSSWCCLKTFLQSKSHVDLSTIKFSANSTNTSNSRAFKRIWQEVHHVSSLKIDPNLISTSPWHLHNKIPRSQLANKTEKRSSQRRKRMIFTRCNAVTTSVVQQRKTIPQKIQIKAPQIWYRSNSVRASVAKVQV